MRFPRPAAWLPWWLRRRLRDAGRTRDDPAGTGDPRLGDGTVGTHAALHALQAPLRPCVCCLLHLFRTDRLRRHRGFRERPCLRGPPSEVREEDTRALLPGLCTHISIGPRVIETLPANYSLNSSKKLKTVIPSNPLSTYNQQLWLTCVVELEPSEETSIQTSFTMTVKVDGVSQDGTTTYIHNKVHNRTRTLTCAGKCAEIIVAHLGYLNYTQYRVTVGFEHLNQPIKDMNFTWKTYNPAFSRLEIWFRFVFVVLTFIVIIPHKLSCVCVCLSFIHALPTRVERPRSTQTQGPRRSAATRSVQNGCKRGQESRQDMLITPVFPSTHCDCFCAPSKAEEEKGKRMRPGRIRGGPSQTRKGLCCLSNQSHLVRIQ